MAYFAMQYQIHFHDTDAYGSHHHITNLKLQNIARETLLFEGRVGESGWKDQFKDIVLVTREAYSLNLAPVNLGEKVAILLAFQDPTPSTVRLCFRIIRFDGQPVSCGYQTMSCVHRGTHEVVPVPQLVVNYAGAQGKSSITEKLTNPSFAEIIGMGTERIKQIFPDTITSLGKYIANLPAKMAYPKIIDESYNEYSFGDEDNLSVPGKKTVILFPGQGSYHHKILRELYTSCPQTAPYFHLANNIALRFLEHEFLPLVTASSPEEHDHLLKACPDLNQIGIYMTGVLTARFLMHGGIKPDLLLGHSFGELAALATAGVYTIETGMKIVCQRILALQSLHEAGKMVAVSCGPDRAKEAIFCRDIRN
jgi:acyl-CoA thioesterase FadM